MSANDTMPTQQNLETMVRRKHVMLLYDSMDHYRRLASRYISDGLEKNDRCIMATDQYSPDQIRTDFDKLGVDMDRSIAKGQLILLSVKDSYSQTKEFDPDETLKIWQNLTDKACEEGYDRLRVIGEATFALAKPGLYKKLIHYENIINKELFPHYPHISTCIYAKDLYPPEVIKAAIQAHPMLVYNDRIYTTNIYYIPPEIYFRKRAKEREVDRWLDNMAANNSTAQALVQSEEKLRTIFNNANDGFYIHHIGPNNLPGTFIAVNDQAVNITGYTREELLQMSPLDFADREQSHMQNTMQELLTKGHATFESQHRTKSGSSFPVEVSSHMFSLRGLRTVFSAVRDITLRKQTEEHERELQEQMRQLQRSEVLGTMTGGVAHDFNNILTIIMGYTELAQSKLEGNSPAHNNLEQVQKGAMRARDIIKQLLTFARKKNNALEDLDIRPVVKEGLKMLRSTIPKGIDFSVAVPRENDFPRVRADATQIHQVLVNLCTNAAHAMGSGTGTLGLKLETLPLKAPVPIAPELLPGNYVRMSISDTGEGIAPENMHRIFAPYFTTKDSHKGTGLGLSVVQGIVKSHNGAIRCTSESGHGTTFEVYLPVAAEIDRHPRTAGSASSLPIPTGNATVLFVDDEEDLVSLGRQRLTRLGYRVQVATDPRGALEMFTADPEKFDMVITDMTMPGMDGLALAQRIKETNPQTPVILCSGFSDTLSGKSTKDLGVDLYLDKPIELSTLACAIRDLLKNPPEVHR
ncbi:MEDS domain-containing protein [Desulfoplanes sp.]